MRFSASDAIGPRLVFVGHRIGKEFGKIRIFPDASPTKIVPELFPAAVFSNKFVRHHGASVLLGTLHWLWSLMAGKIARPIFIENETVRDAHKRDFTKIGVSQVVASNSVPDSPTLLR